VRTVSPVCSISSKGFIDVLRLSLRQCFAGPA